jgi:hypothetical protein
MGLMQAKAVNPGIQFHNPNQPSVDGGEVNLRDRISMKQYNSNNY